MSSRALTVLLGLAGAGLVTIAASRSWAVAAATALPGRGEVSVTGREAVPAVVALALAAAAGAVVMGTAGRLVRLLVAAGLVAAGLAALAVAVGAGTDPDAAVRPALRAAEGLTSASSGPLGADRTVWPWIAAAGGVMIAVAGVAGLARGRTWPNPARRLESPSTPAPDRRDAALSDWETLSRGGDPTDATDATDPGDPGGVDPPAASGQHT